MQSRYEVAVFSLLLIIMTAISWSAIPTHALTVWSDDFEDGDYNGWTVLYGAANASTGVLRGSGWWYASTLVYHSSSVAEGTWSFDFYRSPQRRGGRIGFIQTTTPGDYITFNGYSLVMESSSTSDNFRIEKWIGGKLNLTFDRHTPEYSESGCYHIDITRGQWGELNLFVNNTYAFSAYDMTFNISAIFFFQGGAGTGLDNVVVSNTVDYTASSITTSTTPSLTTTEMTTFSTSGGFPIEWFVLGAAIVFILIFAESARRSKWQGWME